MKKKLAYGFVLSMLSFQAFAAQTDNDKTIVKLTVETGDKGYITVAEGFTLPCLYNVAYFDLTSESGRGQLSLLMAAKIASKKVSVVYNKDTSNICTLTHVSLE